MKKHIAVILLLSLTLTAYADDDSQHESEADEVVVQAQSSGRQGRRPEIYTPQQAIADTLSEPLTFVGRGIPDPIRDDSGHAITEGASQYCVFKNSKVYVVHQGCRPNAQMPVGVMIMEVYRRSGQSIRFYAEPSASTYSVESINDSFRGTWNVTMQRTPPINGDMNLESFFQYYNTQSGNTESGSCVYGRTVNSNGSVVYVCAQMPKENSWREAAAEFYSTPSNARFNEFHDAVKNAKR